MKSLHKKKGSQLLKSLLPSSSLPQPQPTPSYISAFILMIMTTTKSATTSLAIAIAPLRTIARSETVIPF